ncbi:hypothetical protein LH61_01325 [Leuconostoc mesenteroides P45]|uniref:MepB family protein n=1 Tax=Leuconostoc mesenteroides TaxID=1245 RepID=UPI0004FFD690|nr:MepB family protein [Leuconostoc mesenteroides]KGB50184.1 hypothetical protein LH61_01325 [Leuconostoc mesenteroides P45]
MESPNLIEGVVARVYQCDVTRVSEESQNNEYEGTTLFFGNKSLRTRLAKKTPTKQEYFVDLSTDQVDEDRLKRLISKSNC